MMVLIILIIALSAMVLVLYLYRRRDKAAGYTPYIEGLVALLDQNDALAMKKLQEAVNVDSDLVDAYVRLGDLYRAHGWADDAYREYRTLARLRRSGWERVEAEVRIRPLRCRAEL